MTPITPSPIPEGWMLVPKAWQPIMDEIERRADKMSGDSRFTVEIDADDIESINATPSPIFQAADLLEKAALVCENMACAPQFEPEIQDRMLRAAAKSIRALATAPTTGSAPTVYLRQSSEFGPWLETGKDDPFAVAFAPASPAASVLTDEQIDEIYIIAMSWDSGKPWFVERVRALLAASMGGDKS